MKTIILTICILLAVGCTPAEQGVTAGSIAGWLALSDDAQTALVEKIAEANARTAEIDTIIAAGGVPSLNPELAAEIKNLTNKDWNDPKVYGSWAILAASLLGGGSFVAGKKRNGS